MTTVKTIAKLLTTRKLTLATAESCTGGLISHTLTNIPGASNFYRGGVVAYANDIKVRFVGVPAGLIKKYGAVSAQVARAMAEGIRKKTKADFSLAVTGIAGPTGGTRTKPVGLVFIVAATLRHTSIKRFIFKGTRLQIKAQAAAAALGLLLKLIR
jgi:PncC family amidohydrolase